MSGAAWRKNAAVSGVRGSSFYKIAYFFPQVLSIVIVALLFQFAFNPTSGMLNSTLKTIGLGSIQPDWLGDPSLALVCVMSVLVWSTVGFFVVLFSAGMASIPKDFYEAALLDGASRFTTFFKITLPLLWDTVQSGWVYMGILALGVEAFTAVQVMTVGPGGPDYSTTVLPLYVYQTAFRDGQAKLRDDDRRRTAHRHHGLRRHRDAAGPSRSAGVLMLRFPGDGPRTLSRHHRSASVSGSTVRGEYT